MWMCSIIPLERGMVTPLGKPIHLVHLRASRELMAGRSYFHKAHQLLDGTFTLEVVRDTRLKALRSYARVRYFKVGKI